MPLTDKAIRHARPGIKPRKIFDGSGLYLEVSPRGGKWWRFKYRFGAKDKRISLGVYPDVSLKEARKRREQARQMVANEIDPSEHRKAHKASIAEGSTNCFEAIARECSLNTLPTGPVAIPAGSSADWSGTSSPGSGTSRSMRSMLPNCCRSPDGSNNAGPWKLLIAPFETVDRSSVTPWPPDGLCVILLGICGGRYRPSREST